MTVRFFILVISKEKKNYKYFKCKSESFTIVTIGCHRWEIILEWEINKLKKIPYLLRNNVLFYWHVISAFEDMNWYNFWHRKKKKMNPLKIHSLVTVCK